MREELDEKLCRKYPLIFANRDKSMQETAMCWGFAHGDGWYNIIDQLCANIQHHIDWNNQNVAKGYKQYKKVPQVVADQVKEKFGTLRFYYHGGDDEISGMVRMAEAMSAVICEECGAPGHQRSGGWIRTLCDHHESERQRIQQERTKEYAKNDEQRDYKFVHEDSGSHD
jgi:hypothetical protein